MTHNIDVLIITRDRASDLERCLLSIVKFGVDIASVIIVDSSTDLNFQALNRSLCIRLEHKVNIHLIQKDLPLGTLPTARNLGMSLASAEFILFLDDDAFIDNSTFPALFSLISSNPSCHIFGCRIIQGPEVSINLAKQCGQLPSFKPIRWTIGNFNLIGTGIVKVAHLQGTFMCFRRSVLTSCGGFNESLSIGYASFEDTEAVLRVAMQSSSPIFLTLDGVVIHGVSPRLNGTPRDIGMSTKLAFSYARNGTITSIARFGFFSSCVFMLPVFVYNLLKIIKGLLRDRQIRRLAAIPAFLLGQVSGAAVSVRGRNRLY